MKKVICLLAGVPGFLVFSFAARCGADLLVAGGIGIAFYFLIIEIGEFFYNK